MCIRDRAPHVHARHPHHAYAYVARHDHTHTHKHSKVYKCTHCGRKSHLAKFCYDKLNALNFAKKIFWVPNKTNPQGPKRKWVPKPSPCVFDVGEGSHTRERNGALMVDAHGLDGHIYKCIAIRRFGGSTTMFGDLEHSSLVGNYF